MMQQDSKQAFQHTNTFCKRRINISILYLLRSNFWILICFLLFGATQQAIAQKSAEDFYKRGLQKMKNLDFTGAISDFNVALDLKPQYAEAFLKRASAKDGLEDYKGAVSDYNKALEIRPNWAEAFMSRGLARFFIPDMEGSCADFIKAGKLGDTSGYSYVRQYCKTDFINKEAETLFKEGVNKFNSGKHIESIADFSSAVRINPQFADAYFYRARAKSKLSDFRGAIQDYTRVVEIKPDYVKAYYNRGYARSEIEDYENAVYDYTKAIKLDPNNAKYFFNRGNAKFKLGEKESACNDFSKAGELGDAEAYTIIKKFCK